MFESAVIESRGTTRRPWTVCVSFLLQFMMVGVLVVVPLVFTDVLPKAQLAGVLLAPAPPPPPPPPPPPGNQKAAPTRAVRVFNGTQLMAYTKMPEKAQIITDDFEVGESSGSRVGVPGGMVGGDPNGVVGAILTKSAAAMAPPPPPPPEAPVKKAVVENKAPVQIRQGGQVMEAKLITRVMPIYPPLAKAARISGAVHLTGIIGTDGHIRQLQVVSGHPLLVGAAVDAVRQWVYRPTHLNGEPVEVIAPITVTFLLN